MNAKFSKLTVLLSALMTSGAASACEYHNNPMFGPFSPYQSFAHQKDTLKPAATLELKHNSQVTATVNEAAELKIEYMLPESFEDVALTFSGTESVKVQGDTEVKINYAQGFLTLTFEVQQKGQHIIEIRAEALNNGRPYSLLKQVRVIAV